MNQLIYMLLGKSVIITLLILINITYYRTILYELITRKYPFTTDALGFAYEYEVVVFLVGKGHRQHFKSTDIPKQLKVNYYSILSCHVWIFSGYCMGVLGS